MSEFKEAAKIIRSADALIITAGAGMGVDSGLPDFRGNQGFWREYPAIAKLGKSFSEMANPQWFFDDPKIAWAFYGHRLNLYRETAPHDGFYKLLELGKKMTHGFFVFTSNVDGQFQKAGFDDNRIDECHGSIHHFQCIHPCTDDIWDGKNENITVDMDTFQAEPPYPKCKNCDAIARPNILMFGDWSWVHRRSANQSGRMDAFLQDLYKSKANTVIIEMGAGTYVPTVRYKSESIANKLTGTLIRINPRDYHVPSGHISIKTGALEGINKILSFL